MRLENTFLGASGVGTGTERRLWQQGIGHWDEFDADAVDRVRGIGPSRAADIRAFVDEARDRLDAGDAGFFADALPDAAAWRLHGNFGVDACYLDIETTGLDAATHDVTTVSLHRGGETTTLVRGRNLTRGALLDAIADTPLLVTFNGRRFDVPFLESSFDCSLDLPHLDLLYPCQRLGFTGGLKAVECELDVDRDRPDLSGRDAVRLWRRYERRDDEDALDTLVSYNRDDTANLEPLADRVADRLHDEVFVVDREEPSD